MLNADKYIDRLRVIVKNEEKYFLYNNNCFPVLFVTISELKTVINQFEKPGILFPMENLQECWKNFWFLSGDSWNPDNIKKCPETYKLLNIFAYLHICNPFYDSRSANLL